MLESKVVAILKLENLSSPLTCNLDEHVYFYKNYKRVKQSKGTIQ